jgi:RpiR family carbohydrate utilization transcriptional regulator
MAIGNAGGGAVLARVRVSYPNLSPAERQVADLFERAPDQAVRMPVVALAKEAGVSEATVIRFSRSLGYDGLRELKLELAGEALSAAETVHQAVKPSDDLSTLVTKVMQFDMQAIAEALAVIDISAMQLAVELLAGASRIQCYGAGSSTMVTQEAFYRFLRLGLPAAVETNWHMQATSAAHLPAGSVAFAVSRTGRTRQTLAALRWAKRSGAKTVVMTSYRGEPISELADVELIVAAPDDSIRPEAVATRIAHLAVIDALSVALAMRNPDKSKTALLIDEEIGKEGAVED